ncbi:hypothetical protein YB2330_005461 [Saitoella coloradoensis]
MDPADTEVGLLALDLGSDIEDVKEDLAASEAAGCTVIAEPVKGKKDRHAVPSEEEYAKQKENFWHNVNIEEPGMLEKKTLPAETKFDISRIKSAIELFYYQRRYEGALNLATEFMKEPSKGAPRMASGDRKELEDLARRCEQKLADASSQKPAAVPNPILAVQMSSTFTFNFADEDIDIDENEQLASATSSLSLECPASTVPSLPHRVHDLTHFVSSLPHKLNYSTLNIPNTSARIPKRELWDIKLQLMHEEDLDDVKEEDERTKEALNGVDDVIPGIYEGGFKTWECSIDLSRYLSAEISAGRLVFPERVAELGCGSALPSMHLLHQALLEGHVLALTLQDYNASVLQHVTVPNIYLAWAMSRAGAEEWEDDGEIDIMDEDKTAFLNDLKRKNIQITLLSGGWGQEMLEYMNPAPTILLASETIYSPNSLPAFMDVLHGCCVAGSQALVAAKKVYFGVGGGVDEFKRAVETRNLFRSGVVDDVSTQGVARTILKVEARS